MIVRSSFPTLDDGNSHKPPPEIKRFSSKKSRVSVKGLISIKLHVPRLHPVLMLNHLLSPILLLYLICCKYSTPDRKNNRKVYFNICLKNIYIYVLI